uniref:Predicted protein n=1 Tax=Hordeum vulgare subsp. vulgare TaxID=112509 RepID=F2CX86_HORVV|nr:predicted protein [Hordeum vulgare subsp. vulgare]
MLRLRSRVLARLLSSPATSPVSHLRPLLSATAPTAGFAVEDYLISTCGLTRPQALKASTKLSHLKSASKPDAVLAFLAGLGLSAADAAALVTRDPQLLCTSVEKTLAPNVVQLTGLGWSRSEVAQLVSVAGANLRPRSVVSKLLYLLLLFGSFESLLRALKFNSNLLQHDLDRAVKPNARFLRECGLDPCAISKLCVTQPWLLTTAPERVRLMVASAERIGVPRESRMFRHALQAVAFLTEDKIAAKVDYLKNIFRWSDAEVGIAVCKAPCLLRKSRELLQRRSEFLISEVGLEPSYIAERPVIILYKLEGRMRPRYCVVKFLMENGLLKRDPSYNTVFKESEKVFAEMFICPHKEAAPQLAQDYATACEGAVPTRFRFT